MYNPHDTEFHNKDGSGKLHSVGNDQLGKGGPASHRPTDESGHGKLHPVTVQPLSQDNKAIAARNSSLRMPTLRHKMVRHDKGGHFSGL